jgi:amidohydrolase
VAMLMGVAEVLAGMRNDLPGTVKFIFQPAEEGAPAGERGGAALMIEEGALDDPKPGAIFGLHVFPYPAGEIRYRPGGAMASSDMLRIIVRGRQTHGAQPWAGIDPIVVASQIVVGLQTITSRQVDITAAPAIVTVGAINGGVRYNIIPDSVVMIGTIRTFDSAMRTDIHQRVRRTAESIAQSAGASALVVIDTVAPVTYNDPALTEWLLPTLRTVAGTSHVALGPPITAAEDFAQYQRRVPGVFFFLGITPPGTDPSTAAPNHSPRFYVDEAALPVGVRALAHAAVDYLSAKSR